MRPSDEVGVLSRRRMPSRDRPDVHAADRHFARPRRAQARHPRRRHGAAGWL